VFVDDDGTVVQGSSHIIDYADRRWPERRLTPASPELEAEARELEAHLDRELGRTARRVFYSYMLESPRVTIPLFAHKGPWWGPAFYRAAFPVVAKAIRTMYDVRPSKVEGDKERFAAAIKRLEERLAAHRYLVGDKFSRVDVTAAALMAPMWRPPEHPIAWQEIPPYPAGLGEWRREFEESPVRQYVLRIYREHRPRHGAVASSARERLAARQPV
jgi:glutathione S-transferase